jgi:hypothetical protein
VDNRYGICECQPRIETCSLRVSFLRASLVAAILDYIVLDRFTEGEPSRASLNETIKIGIEIGDFTQNVDLGFSFHSYLADRTRQAKPWSGISSVF